MLEGAAVETSEEEWEVGMGLSESDSFDADSPRIRLRTRALFDLLCGGLSAMLA